MAVNPIVPDLVGTDPAYRVNNEPHTIQDPTYEDYRIIFPREGAFHINSYLKIYNNGSQLVEGVDYRPTLEFVGASRVASSAVYGGILLLKDSYPSAEFMVDYQALGGTESLSYNDIVLKLLDVTYNTRTTLWDDIIDVPEAFTPGIHYHDEMDLVYRSELIDKMQDISDSISDASERTANEIAAAILDVMSH